jgi:hypothetical protein
MYRTVRTFSSVDMASIASFAAIGISLSFYLSNAGNLSPGIAADVPAPQPSK